MALYIASLYKSAVYNITTHDETRVHYLSETLGLVGPRAVNEQWVKEHSVACFHLQVGWLHAIRHVFNAMVHTVHPTLHRVEREGRCLGHMGGRRRK